MAAKRAKAGGRSQVVPGVDEDLTARKRAEKALRESRARYRDLIETTGDFIWEVDPQGRYTYCSPQMEKLWGLKPQEMIGRTPFDQMPPGAREEGLAFYLGAAGAKQPFSGIQVPSLDSRGIPITIEISGVPFFDDRGELLGYRGITRDVTERERTQKELVSRETLLRALTDNSPDAIYVKDAQSRWLMANPAVLRIVGKKAEEALGKTDLELYADPSIGRAILENDRRILEGKKAETFEEWADTPDGRRLFLSTKAPWFDAEGNVVGLIGISRDITDRKRAEEELRKSGGDLAEANRRKTDILESISDCFYALDRDLRFVYVNRAAEEIWGLSRADLIGRKIEDVFAGRIDVSLSRFHQALEEQTPQHYEVYSKVIQRWGSMSVYPATDGLSVYFHDVTERKRAEEALRESEERFRSLNETSPIGVGVSSADGVLLYVNPAYESILGYDRDELLGKRASDLYVDPADRTSWLQVLKATGAVRNVETRLRRKDGRPIWASISVSDLHYGGQQAVIGTMQDISARKRAEEKLRRQQAELQESEKRYRLLVQHAPAGIFEIDLRAGRFTEVNEVVCRILGYSRDEFLAMDPLDLLDEEGKGRLSERIRQGGLGALPAEAAEYRVRRKDGQFVWALVNATFEHEAGVSTRATVVAYDISDRKRAEELRRALAEQEKARLGAAVEQASDAVIMIDLDGTIRYVNAAFEAIDGIPRDKAVGTSYFHLLAGEPDVVAAVRKAFAAGRPWRGPLTRSVRDGRPVELEVAVFPAKDAEGNLIGGLVTEKDITQENALQRQLRHTQKIEALGTLAGGITHDFNNILGAIVLNTEIALMDLEPGHPARTVLPSALKAAIRGKELVKQIITFSRQQEWDKRPFEVGPVIEDALAFLRATLPKNISIRESVAPGAGAIFGDPSQFYQIIVNLCQNAAQAIAEKEGLIQLELEPVLVDQDTTAAHPHLKAGPYVRVIVMDDGPGMTPEILDRIFEPFFTTRRSSGGTGLGLAVVDGVVKNYGGDIGVTSAPGQGTVFRVLIPRWEGEIGAASEPSHADHNGRGERVLLVEDDTPQRNSLSAGLRRMGFRVVSKPSASDALEAFQTTPAAYDIVITDQMMPGMSGLDMAAELSRLRPDLPIILCTGFSEQVDQMTVGQNGVRELIMKPFTLREIAQLIRRTVAGRR